MEENWIKVYNSADFFRAEMVRQVLIDQEIEAVLLDKQGFPYKIGVVEIYIHKQDFDRAIEIIIKNEL